jgi:hypothetical protein
MKTFRRLFCFLLIILSVSTTFAQNNDFERKNQLKISPIRLFDFVNPGIELGYERKHAERFSTQLSLGLMKDYFSALPLTGYTGTRISLEEKLFLQGRLSNQYFSVEGVYLNVRHNASSTFIQDTALNTPEYNDSFRVAKQTYSLNARYGIQIPIKRFVIDFSAGLGLKYKAVEWKHVFDRNAYEVPPPHPNVYRHANKEGKYFAINLPVSLKFGYIF